MEIQVRTGNFAKLENLVLDIHLSKSPNQRRDTFFMAEIYETDSEGNPETRPLFYCRGSGYSQWKTASALIAFLACECPTARTTDLPQYKEFLARWVYALEAGARQFGHASYKVRLQIRDKGRTQDLRKSENWLSQSIATAGIRISTLVRDTMAQNIQNSILDYAHE